MNCPHHNQIYASRPRSYRDLPFKYFETTTVYRDEKTGELGGLSRVRSITQDDSHSYCRADQVGDLVAGLIEDVQVLYGTLGMSLRARLSFRDSSDKYLGEPKLWEDAQQTIRDLAEKNELDYFEAEGEAAFYGPKIDFMATDALGREHQVATVQLDFVQPERFKLEYTAEDGGAQRPVMVHCALLGSIERFLSVYIEHTAGRFPVWNAPEQIRLVTVNQEEETVGFANDILRHAKALDLRVTIDNNNESVGKKIRSAEIWRVPYTVVIGEKEIASGQLLPRVRSDMDVDAPHEPRSVEVFLKTVANEAKSRVSKTSL
jgi:threonyl-tRNA synthetase